MESMMIEPVWLPWNISLFRDGFLTVKPLELTVKRTTQVIKFFLDPPWKPHDFPKKKLPCWSPALYKEGMTRSNKGVREISTVVLDYDDPKAAKDKNGNKIEPKPIWSAGRMDAHLQSLGLAYALYTTWSHTAEKPRYRVVFFLSRFINIREFPKVRDHVIELIGYNRGLDTQCKDLSRHYAAPIRRTGVAFESFLNTTFSSLCVDSLMTDTSPVSAENVDSSQTLTHETEIILSEDKQDVASVKELIALGKAKHKCCCPFKEDSSFGSAFLRVMHDGRAFLLCTSEGHAHEKKQYWLKGTASKKKEGKPKVGAHSVVKRRELLAEVPEHLRSYAENSIVFNAPQNVFYRKDNGSWDVGSPLRMDGIKNHLVGKLSDGMDGSHANALIDHILSRQVYGFTCDSSRGSIVTEDSSGPKLNLYCPSDINSVSGEFDRIKELISTICGEDPDAIEWLMHWSASLVQHPERCSMVAVISMSPQQGVGKSMYGRILGRVIGDRNCATVSNNSLRDSFNASFVTKLLVLADEIAVAGSRDGEAVIPQLKSYITDKIVPCRAPYAARATTENRMTWWLTSNDLRPIVLEKGDRRFTVLMPKKVTPKYKKMLAGCFNPKKGNYSKSFLSEIRAYSHVLHNIAVDYRLISTPYQAKARKMLQSATRSSVERFVDTLFDSGVSPTLAAFPPGPDYLGQSGSDIAISRGFIPCTFLYGCYRTWCERNGYRYMKAESDLRIALSLNEKDVLVRKVSSAGSSFSAYSGLPLKENSDNLLMMPQAVGAETEQ